VGPKFKNLPVFDYAIETYLAGEVLKAAITQAGTCNTKDVIKALTGKAGSAMGQTIAFPQGGRLGGTADSLRMVRPQTADPTSGLLQVVK
jgi:ABC-type branched-subunit amino acid transport system substrate-binding protein